MPHAGSFVVPARDSKYLKEVAQALKGQRQKDMDASFDPVAFTIGSLTVRWYGLMYVAGFLLGWLIGRIRAPRYGWKARDVDDLVTICMLGLVLGARIGYILFYDLPLYLDEPSEIFRFWNGGMSFHGGALGLAAAFFYFAKTRKKGFLDIADFITPLVPPGLFFGRMGNFINGELWGKVTTLPWGMIFPSGGPYPRHPSQLYEGFLEGIVLFIVLLLFTRRQRRTGQTAGLFCLFYGLCRFAVEFVRLPDAQLGYLAFGWLTMGQILSLPMLALGLWLLLRKAPLQEYHPQ